MTSSQAIVGDLALRHLDAAYNLGRWLLGNEQDAADAVHDAYVRAARSSDTYAGGNARAWWLAIVRNCCLARLATRGSEQRHVAIDQIAAEHGREAADSLLAHSDPADVEDRLDHAQRRALIARHLQELPTEFRETLILREIEELSYREIADVLQAPIGTVMSRLARGRALLQKSLGPLRPNEVNHGL
ncbi:MAG: sigma-70 family RNA polymerase sigma factor [Dokdonella sp.]